MSSRNFLVLLFLSLLLSCTQTEAKKPVVSILGDSYSTFSGHNPKTNAVWYTGSTSPDRTDVSSVEDTWWMRLIRDGNYELGENDSYSGATICYTGYNGENYKDRSFLSRLSNLGNPDIILIFGGTNDCWASSPIGEYVYGDFSEDNLYSFRPALAKLFEDAKAIYPDAKIYFILNSELTPDISESAETICEHYSIPCIYLENIEKIAGHPSKAGMNSIKDQVLAVIKD